MPNIASGLTDLLQSERGVFCIVALICATVLGIANQLTVDQWLDFAKWLSAFLIASKTVTTAVETFALKKPQITPVQSPVPAPTPETKG
jgi:undecaprenyl pyrophosphate phosphatase UppP